MPEEQPDQWLKNRFLRHERWPSTIVPTALHVSQTKGIARYNFVLSAMRTTENETHIALQCNIHINIQNSPHKVDEISKAMQNLGEYQDSMRESLDRYLIGNT